MEGGSSRRYCLGKYNLEVGFFAVGERFFFSSLDSTSFSFRAFLWLSLLLRGSRDTRHSGLCAASSHLHPRTSATRLLFDGWIWKSFDRSKTNSAEYQIRKMKNK